MSAKENPGRTPPGWGQQTTVSIRVAQSTVEAAIPIPMRGSPLSGLNNEMSAVSWVWANGYYPEGTICGELMKASSNQKYHPNLCGDLFLNLA